MFVGCSANQEAEQNADGPIKTQVIKTSSDSITIKYTNITDVEYMYGYVFELYIWNDNEWVIVPFNEGYGWDLIGILFKPGKSFKDTIDLVPPFGKLNQGRYKIVKPMNDSSSTTRPVIDELVTTEFEIE
jgi:hypothetical protein